MKQFVAGIATALVLSVAALGAPKAYHAARNRLARYIDFSGTIPGSALAAPQKARYFFSTKPAPLVVDLHAWSSDGTGYTGDDHPLDNEIRKLGWNFVRPELNGANDAPDDCCSDSIMAHIENAISFAKAQGHVEDDAVYIVGGSGGGYTTLCAMMSGRFTARQFIAWVPITDLTACYRQHREDNYGANLLACTRSNGVTLNVEEARRRSPLYMPLTPAALSSRLQIFSGVDDGFRGSVPISHSVRFYNRLVTAAGHPEGGVSDATLLSLFENRQTLTPPKGRFTHRAVIYNASTLNHELTIFDGAHEVLSAEIGQQLASDYAELRDRPAGPISEVDAR